MYKIRHSAHQACLIALFVLLFFFGAARAPAAAGGQEAAAGGGRSFDLDTVVARVTQRLAEIKDLSVRVEVEEREPGRRPVRYAADLQLIYPDLVRLTFHEPDSVAGVISLIERESRKVRTYLPVTDQIREQRLEDLAPVPGQPLPLDFDHLMRLPERDAFRLTVLGQEERAGQSYVVVQGEPRGGTSREHWKMWVSTGTWLLERVEVYDAADRLRWVLAFRNIRWNQGLSAEALRRLPKGEVVPAR